MDIDLSRTRVDFREEPGGVLRAILTITLPGGVERRYEATIDDPELELELEPELAESSATAGVDPRRADGSAWDRYWHPWRYPPASTRERPRDRLRRIAGLPPLTDCIARGEAFAREREAAMRQGYADARARPNASPAALARRAGVAGLVEVGRTSPDHLGPTAAAHRRRLSWRALTNAPSEQPSGWTLDAPAAAHSHWWNALGHDGRKKFKIRYAAIMDNAPASIPRDGSDAGDDALNHWWHFDLTRKQRGKYKDRAEVTFLERVGKVAKEVVTSKVFQAAAIGLVAAVPGLGAIAAPALAAAATLQTGAKLLKASGLAKRGEHEQARQATTDAVASARKASKTPEETKAIVDAANVKRKNVELLAAVGRPDRIAPRVRPSSSSSARGPVDVLEAARAGKLRSNKGGEITSAELLAAHKAGRVFWVAA